MSRIVTLPRVTCCRRLSTATIWGRNFGVTDHEPMRTARGVSRPMAARVGRTPGGRPSGLAGQPGDDGAGLLDRLGLLVGELLLTGPRLDRLGVAPGVGAPVDRGQHHPVAAGVEQGQRPRQPPAHVAEGVVPDQPGAAEHPADVAHGGPRPRRAARPRRWAAVPRGRVATAGRAAPSRRAAGRGRRSGRRARSGRSRWCRSWRGQPRAGRCAAGRATPWRCRTPRRSCPAGWSGTCRRAVRRSPGT